MAGKKDPLEKNIVDFLEGDSAYTATDAIDKGMKTVIRSICNLDDRGAVLSEAGIDKLLSILDKLAKLEGLENQEKPKDPTCSDPIPMDELKDMME